jgi:hypothetical protein
MKEPTSEQVDRLPVWAQKRIRSLEGRVVVLQRALLDLKDSRTPTNAWVTNSTLELGDRYYLPNDRITFRLGEDTELQVHVEDGRLEITGIGFSCYLDVQPRVSNAISVGARDR